MNKIIIDFNMITDPKELSDRFNEFFVGIGHKLASNISTENKKAFSPYRTHRINITLVVDRKDIETHISSLKTKTSFGVDGISIIFLKFLSPALTKPLSVSYLLFSLVQLHR